MDEILHYCDKESTSDRTVLVVEDKTADTRTVISVNDDETDINSTSDDDSDLSGESHETDENNNVAAAERSTICLVLNKTVKRKPDGTEEEIRDSHAVYSEDLNPEDINFRDVACEILTEAPRHFEDGYIRIVRGNYDVNRIFVKLTCKYHDTLCIIELLMYNLCNV